MPRRPSMGRQRIEIKRIEKEESRQVTFSKRRGGVFKKASELSILCGAEVAIVLFSLAGKAFSFGHPSVDSVIDRFLTGNANRDDNPVASLTEANRRANVRDLSNQYTDIMTQIAAEKRRGEELEQARRTSVNQFWWDYDQLGLTELETLKNYMGNLKNQIAKRYSKLLINGTANIGRSIP